ncbi:MAG: dihydroorotate dehydrogenase electron transfer subunit [Candidatus Micrarchaeota archaeon]|nr:dihydroorotate dehydrogenase electron transfer subunit [Candidatus Micrarchaeota archaeon]
MGNGHGLPEIVKIEKIVDENRNAKTFFLDKRIGFKPGQFLMVWIPGLGEKPFSISYAGAMTGITVYLKGKFTRRLFEMNTGDRIGIRGPYGNGFTLKGNACVVGGGAGIAPLAPLIENLDDPYVILGAKNADELLFDKRFPDAMITTDDGSKGFSGFTTELLKNILKERAFDVVYTCGPEIMMKKVFEICENAGIKCQASLERYMKCGIGVCGHCEIDGFRVCKDGPVFSSEQLRIMESFGKTAKLKNGEKVSIEDYTRHRYE